MFNQRPNIFLRPALHVRTQWCSSIYVPPLSMPRAPEACIHGSLQLDHSSGHHRPAIEALLKPAWNSVATSKPLGTDVGVPTGNMSTDMGPMIHTTWSLARLLFKWARPGLAH